MYVINCNTKETYRFDDENAILALMDLGVIPNELSTSKAVNQIGETVVDQQLGRREWQLVGCLTAETPQQMQEKRRKTTRFFHPLHRFELICGDRKLEFRLQSSVDYDDDYRTDTGEFLQYTLSAVSPQPYFQAVSPIAVEIAQWMPKFTLPFTLPMQFAEREPSVIAQLYNPGDFECGIKISFSVTGAVTDPEVVDVNDTSRYFRFSGLTLQAGDFVEVNTQEKTVLLTRDGETSDIFNDIDMRSTFLYLPPGDSLIKYDAKSNPDGLNVTISFTPLYLDEGGNA